MKKHIGAALLLSLAAVPAHAQGIPISSLPSATTPLTGSELSIVVQGGVTKKAPVSAFVNLPTIAFAGLTFNKVTVTQPATGSTLTILDGKTLTINNTLGLSGTNGSTLNIGTGGTLGVLAFATTPLSVANGGTGAGTFTANLPLIGNGTGAIGQGTRSGNTTAFATASGALTNGHCVSIDASGNFVDSGAGCGGSGTVTSVTPGAGLVSSVTASCSQSAITTSGTLSGAECVNAQTGTSYAIADSDRGKLITASNAAAQAYTIAQAGAASAFQTGWYTDVRNISTNPLGVVTITPTTSTIDGASTFVLQPGAAARIVSDGTNYQIANNTGAFNSVKVKTAVPAILSVSVTGVDFNSASTDNAITIALPTGYTRWVALYLRLSNASHSLTTATAGMFTTTGGGGQTIAASQALTVSATADATNNNAMALTLTNGATESYTTTSVQFRVGTAEGAAATADVSFGYFILP